MSPRRGEGIARSIERPQMPGTYSQILLHIVFSTKRRELWITADVAERLHAYMGGIVRAERGVLYAIGGACQPRRPLRAASHHEGFDSVSK